MARTTQRLPWAGARWGAMQLWLPAEGVAGTASVRRIAALWVVVGLATSVTSMFLRWPFRRTVRVTLSPTFRSRTWATSDKEPSMELPLAQAVLEYMGPDSLAMWLIEPGWEGWSTRSGAAAVAAGLHHRVKPYSPTYWPGNAKGPEPATSGRPLRPPRTRTAGGPVPDDSRTETRYPRPEPVPQHHRPADMDAWPRCVRSSFRFR